MKGNILSTLKLTDSNINYPQRKKREKKEAISSFAVLLNGFMESRENRKGKEKKEIAEAVRTSKNPKNLVFFSTKVDVKKTVHDKAKEKFQLHVTEVEEKEGKESKTVGKNENTQLNLRKGTPGSFLKMLLAQEEKSSGSLTKRKRNPRYLVRNEKSSRLELRNVNHKKSAQNSAIKRFNRATSEVQAIAKPMRTEELPESLAKRELKTVIKGERAFGSKVVKFFLRKGNTKSSKENVLAPFKQNSEKKITAEKMFSNEYRIIIKPDTHGNVSQEKNINSNTFRLSQPESQNLKEFVKSHYEPMEGVVKFYTEMSDENSVKVLLNSRLGIAKLLFLSTQNNFRMDISVIQNLINTLNNLGFSNVSVGYNNYYGEGKNGGNQGFRGNRSSKFITVTEVEAEEEELVVEGGIDIMV